MGYRIKIFQQIRHGFQFFIAGNVATEHLDQVAGCMFAAQAVAANG